MTNPTQADYQAALDAVNIANEQWLTRPYKYPLDAGTVATIRYALALAAKVTGEPSKKMKLAGWEAGVMAELKSTTAHERVIYFKAMIAQAQQEVQDENH